MRGAEPITAFLEHSPFVGHLRIELGEIGGDRAVLALPFREEVVTIGDVVHGGADDGTLAAAGLVTRKLS